jgi:hypothetical protein
MNGYDIRPVGYGDDAEPGQTSRKGYLGQYRIAPYWRRFLAGCIDYIPLLLVMAWLMGPSEPQGQPVRVFGVLDSPDLPTGHAFLVVLIGAIAALWAANDTGLGESLGKDLVGLVTVYPVRDPATDEAHLGYLANTRLVLRLFAHLIDLFLVWGWFRPLRDRYGQTYADEVAGTVVIVKPKEYPAFLVGGERLL